MASLMFTVPGYPQIYTSPTDYQDGSSSQYPPGAYGGSVLESVVEAPVRERSVVFGAQEVQAEQNGEGSESQFHESNDSEDEKDSSKCQLGIVLNRLPFSKIRSRFECQGQSFASLDVDDLLYLMIYIPEDSIVPDSIVFINSPQVYGPELPSPMKRRSSIGGIGLGPLGSAQETSGDPNIKGEPLSYSEFNSYYYLLERIRTKYSPSPDDANFLGVTANEQINASFRRPRKMHTLNHPGSILDKSEGGSRWMDLIDDKKVRYSAIKEQFEGSRGQSVVLELRLLPERDSSEKKYSNQRVRVELMFKFNVPNEIHSFVKPRLKQEFDLIEASDKVITLLSRITMSNKWACCSANTYGFFIRNVLLAGSNYERQIVRNTKSLLFLSSVTVMVSFGMQVALSWYLWAYLPFHPRDDDGYLHPNPPVLQSVWYPNQGDLPKYSVCRTNPVVQVICIGLFLFYMLNAIPGILKNALIVLWSSKFISEDTNGVLRIHYWRTCSFWAGLFSLVRTPFPMEIIDSAMVKFFTSDEDYVKRNIFFLPLSKTLFSWTTRLPPYIEESPEAWPKDNDDWIKKDPGPGKSDETDRRLYYELRETRDFLRRKLAAINPETFELEEGDEDLQEMEDNQDVAGDQGSEEDEDTINEKIEAHRRKIEGVQCAVLDQGDQDKVRMLNDEIEEFQEKLWQIKEEKRDTKIERTRDAAEYLVCTDYCDGTDTHEADRVKTGYFARTLSLVAFVFGVLPELVSTTMIMICGIEYILWSGSKVGSDTNGIEEIVLASLAIVFINEIDEALYDHALPELYKTAHERDRFNLENWVPADEPAEMEDEETETFMWWPKPVKAQFEVENSKDDKNSLMKRHDSTRPGGEKEYYSREAFEWCMHLDKVHSKRMDNEKHSDMCFSRQYPFLYARKYRYFFQEHVFEGIIWAYGSLSVHIILLGAMSLAIVGGFRAAHQCQGPQGAFSFYTWPDTCDTWDLTTKGVCS